MSPEILSVLGVAVAIIMIIFLVMRDVPILLTGLIGVVIMAATGGLGLKEALLDTYMIGYANYFGRYFLMFLTGALLGRIYESTGAAESIAVLLGRLFGPKWAPLATVLSAGLMCYGGVSLFVVAFAVYPIAARLYKEANLPRTRRNVPRYRIFCHQFSRISTDPQHHPGRYSWRRPHGWRCIRLYLLHVYSCCRYDLVLRST